MKLNKTSKIAFAIMLLLFIENVATGADVLPGAVLPEQVSKSISQQRPTTPTEVLPPLKNAAQQPPSPLGPEAKKIKFQLNGIILEGNHVYSEAQLRPLYANKLHKIITIAELFNIVQSITNFYRNNGYI